MTEPIDEPIHIPQYIEIDELTTLMERLDEIVTQDTVTFARLSGQYRMVTDAMEGWAAESEGLPLSEDPLYKNLCDVRVKIYELRRALEQVETVIEQLQEIEEAL